MIVNAAKQIFPDWPTVLIDLDICNLLHHPTQKLFYVNYNEYT